MVGATPNNNPGGPDEIAKAGEKAESVFPKGKAEAGNAPPKPGVGETPTPPVIETKSTTPVIEAKTAGFFAKHFGKESVMRSTFRDSSTKMKFARVGGITAGVVLVGAGLKEAGRLVGIVSPKQDADGKQLPTGAGTLFKSLAEVGAGAGLLYVSLLKGGSKTAGQGMA